MSGSNQNNPAGATPVYVANPGSGAASKGYQQITSLSAAVALTVPDGATMAVIVPEAQAIRWRDDGTNPTASVGMPVAVGVQFVYSGALSALKLIEQTASAKANITYY